MSRIINPPRYERLLKGSAPCNYGLASRTMYRTLARPDDMKQANQVEAFYKYQYNDFKIDWAMRSFEDPDDFRTYMIFMFTDSGIFREDVSRSIYDNKIYMRWTTFVTKLADRKPQLFVTTMCDSNKIDWFYPAEIYKEVVDCHGKLAKLIIKDTQGLYHTLKATKELIHALEHNQDYVNVDETNYVPVWNFNMWYMVF